MALTVDPGIDHAGGPYVPEGGPSAFADAGYCGRSFEEGLLRFHDAASGPEFRAYVRAAFPEIEDPRVDVLAFDWQGRQIITVRRPLGDGAWGEQELRVADLAGGAVQDLCTLPEFGAILQNDLVGQLFGQAQYDDFREVHGVGDAVLAFDECVEYSHPLFLGGVDSVANMAVTDTAVYWEVVGALRASTFSLAPGTRVDNTID